MGKLGDCIALSVYQGNDGYSDLTTLGIPEFMDTASNFIMHDQTCITYYMGDCQEVPPVQKKMIKDLGFKFRGKNNWPFFLSMKKRYYPYPINSDEAIILTKVMKQLLVTIKEYYQLIDDEHLLYTYFKDNLWHTTSIDVPNPEPKYNPICITDMNLLHDLSNRPQTDQKLIIDLVYLNQPIDEDNLKRPLNALIFIVLDLESQMIISTHMFKAKDDEIDITLGFIINFILQNERPRQIFIRNPLVWSAYQDICEQCDIELSITDLDMVDYIVDDMTKMMR